MKPRSNLIFYLLLNILVSAATTLAVLYVWDRLRGGDALPQAVVQATIEAVRSELTPSPIVTATSEPAAAQPNTAAQTATLPPPDQPVIVIERVVGAGDLQHEVVYLQRTGEGNISMVGWQLEDGDGNTYVFPEQPALTLYQDGRVQVYSKAGDDTAIEVYWDREQAAFRSGETIRLLDRDGNARAEYTIP